MALSRKLETVAPVYALFLNTAKSTKTTSFPFSKLTKTINPIMVIAKATSDLIFVQPQSLSVSNK